MKFKLTSIFLIALFLSNVIMAQDKLEGTIDKEEFLKKISETSQSKVAIKYTESGALFVNDFEVKSGCTAEELTKVLGEPSQKKEMPSTEVGYFYEEEGFVFYTLANGIVNMIGMNFNWDGDERFPETSYTGSFVICETAVTKETELKNLTDFGCIEFMCPAPVMCVSMVEDRKVNCLLGFGEDGLTQFGFVITE